MPRHDECAPQVRTYRFAGFWEGDFGGHTLRVDAVDFDADQAWGIAERAGFDPDTIMEER